MWWAYALLSAVTAALVAIFGKMGLAHVDSTLATTLRAFVMAGFLLIASLALGKLNGVSLATVQGKDWLYIALAGIAGALSWLFYFFALKIGEASKVAVIDRLSVAFVLVLAAMFLGESLKWRSVLGVGLMVAGMLLVTFA